MVSTLQQDAEQSYCGTSNPSVVTVVAAVLPPLPGRSHHEARHDRRCDLPARAHFSRICDPPAREEEVGRRIKKRKKEVQVCSAWPDGAAVVDANPPAESLRYLLSSATAGCSVVDSVARPQFPLPLSLIPTILGDVAMHATRRREVTDGAGLNDGA